MTDWSGQPWLWLPNKLINPAGQQVAGLNSLYLTLYIVVT
jgi:hypothetical protein